MLWEHCEFVLFKRTLNVSISSKWSNSFYSLLKFIKTFIALITALTTVALAEEEFFVPDLTCQPTLTHSSTVVRTSGANSVTLSDGSEVVLSGILMPTALDIPAPTVLWKPEKDAAKVLARLLIGKTLRFVPMNHDRDRYGRLQVQAFIEERGSLVSVEASLVQLGHAKACCD